VEQQLLSLQQIPTIMSLLLEQPQPQLTEAILVEKAIALTGGYTITATFAGETANEVWYDPAQATVSITVVAELTATTLTAESSNAFFCGILSVEKAARGKVGKSLSRMRTPNLSTPRTTTFGGRNSVMFCFGS
jgi:hypothetical protein